ncbi:MAG: tetratricopeptide repeat protein [Verrucomicrobia bacterium]|nr:tetratricopeptide repeat protein [Verrucomicrobiota bacterium]
MEERAVLKKIMATADRMIDVFNEAKSRPAGVERECFLDEVCRGDSALKEQVLSLLQAHEGAGDFLQNTPLMFSTPLLTEKPGDRIGRYKLLEQIGEGGCGVVYMAEQEEPVRRRVALKVIKLGMDTKSVIARFEAERQALALMDHPNIAKVLDAGATETGRPFFVMELVRGIKITDYCDQNNLSTNERLELFIQVCQAIQHAHQKGIIHRDIKPSNILVAQHDEVAVPKVIDFGIAKATTGQLTDKTLFTAFAQFIGTPAYMSPEQAQLSGLDIDTRADIYSLGVLLYELLTGNTPFNAQELLAAGLDEMRRRIREEEPSKPSTCLSTMQAIALTAVAKNRQEDPPKLIHSIRGDLDWLVMKCLEKDRTRRYETANALAMDLQRHLNNEPVVACPPSNLYRFQKLVRRNKFAVASFAAVSMALIIGLGLSTWLFVRERAALKVAAENESRAEQQAQQAELSRQQAEANEKKATAEAVKSQQVAQFLKEMLEGVKPVVAMGRDTTMLREILDKTSERIDKDLKDQPDVEAELRNTLGGVYSVIGQYPSAKANYQKALAMRRKLLGNEHPELATSLESLGLLLRSGRPYTEDKQLVLQLFTEALAIRRKVFGNESAEVAKALHLLGLAFEDQRKLKESESNYREALAIRERLLGPEHEDIVRSLDGLSYTLKLQGKLVEGESLARQALAMGIKLFGTNSYRVSASMMNVAGFSMGNGNLAEAETLRRDALALRRKTHGNEHLELVVSLNLLADVLQRQNKKAEAESLYREALAMRRPLQGDGHADVANSLKWLGDILFEQGKLTEAEELYRERLKNLRAREVSAGDLKNALDLLAKTLLALGKFTEAEPFARESLAIRQKNNSPDIIDSLSLLAEILCAGGKLEQAALLLKTVKTPMSAVGDERDGRPVGREHLMLIQKLSMSADSETVANAFHELGKGLSAGGARIEAESALRNGMAMRKRLFGDEHLDVAESLKELSYFLREQGKLLEAETTARDAVKVFEKLAAKNPTESHYRVRLGHSHWQLGLALQAAARHAEARKVFLEALQSFEKAAHDFPADPFFRQEQAYTHRYLGGVAGALGQMDDAARHYNSAISLYAELAAGSPKRTFYISEQAASLAPLTHILLVAHKFIEAEPIARECLTIREDALPGNWLTFNARSMLGASLLGQEKYAEAEPLLLSGYEGMKQRESAIPAIGKIRIKEAIERLAQFYQATSHSDKAAEWKAKLAEFDDAKAGHKAP